ncbi:hypothetical protein BKP37_12925 [Anaerobacillus alkalilacustris]|uniref:Uncharacterized protein n=1 Tax=Anaerobacillus alkalilacustris TaxID=393763 RepID=A0A1S2LLY2_9BACI|nr:hypothetical protein [Anaerobacillus alkalilacustris]OIJ12697.1 hypothetical protein BKP37_12925 [Anaerobacillus alkalilacustris]
MYGSLFFLNTVSPDRPVEEKYVVEIEGQDRVSFVKKENAMLFLFDNGVSTFQYFTKEISEYKNIKNVATYELWHIENRVGYVLYNYEPFIDENNQVQKRKAYVWRFIGFGKPSFAATKEELKNKVMSLISEYKNDTDNRGLNAYPYFTQYYR